MAYEFENVEVVQETTEAILVQFPSRKETWIPKSQVTDDSEVWEDGQYGTLVVTDWFAEKEGLG